jgi:hypothetical protein
MGSVGTSNMEDEAATLREDEAATLRNEERGVRKDRCCGSPRLHGAKASVDRVGDDNNVKKATRSTTVRFIAKRFFSCDLLRLRTSSWSSK